jgi:hypothetical protein
MAELNTTPQNSPKLLEHLELVERTRLVKALRRIINNFIRRSRYALR